MSRNRVQKRERAKTTAVHQYKYNCCSCALCPYTTRYSSHYKQHLMTHSSERPFTCPELNCHYRAKLEQTLKSHLQNVHLLQSKPMSSRPFPCPESGCSYAAKQKSSLNKHSKTHWTEKSLLCSHPNCSYSTNVQRDLISHTRSHTGEKPFVCQFESCSYATAFSSALLIHSRIHTKERPYKCPELNCGYSGAQNSNLKQHQLVHHPKEGAARPSFSCPLCEYSGKRSGDLSSHFKFFHSDEKPFACSFDSCEYRCKSKQNLSTHLKIHSEDRQYKCELCPYRGKTRTVVRNHYKNIHPDPKFGIGIGLAIGVRPFKCTEPDCDYAAKKNGELQNHLLTHGTEKKYKCSFPGCEYRAIRKDYVAGHVVNIHIEEKREKCGICDYACKTRGALNIHLRTHTKEEPYICKERGCQYQAKQSSALKQHEKKHHPQLFKQGK